MRGPLDWSKQRQTSAPYLRKKQTLPSPQNPYSSMGSLDEQFESERKSTHRIALPPLPMLHQTQSTGIDPLHVSTQLSEKYLKNESIFEAFLINAISLPVHQSIEQTIQMTLGASSVTVWQDIPSLHVLYSETRKTIVEHSTGLVGEAFFKRQLLRIQNCSQHPSYNADVDKTLCPPNCPVLLFPLWDQDSNVCSVVEVVRNSNSNPFTDEDIDFINFFIKKFKIFSHWLLQTSFPTESLIELMQSMELEQFLLLFQKKVPEIFSCSSAEIWKLELASNELTRYTREAQKVISDEAGIAGEVLFKDLPLNCSLNKLQSSYNAKIDGTDSEALLAIPLSDGRRKFKYAIILRGSKIFPVFTGKDETTLKQISPFIVLALSNSEKFSKSGASSERDQLSRSCVDFLFQATSMINEKASVQHVVESLIEKLQMIVNADRGYLFCYDKESETMKTKVTTNYKKPLSVPIDKGIVSKVYRTGKVINLPDAYADPNFDSSLDAESNYKTRSLVSAPISANEILAVVQFMNKRDGKPFSNTDISYIQLFATFIGILCENEKMFGSTSELNIQLKSFQGSSAILSSSSDVKAVISEIMKSAKASTNSERASLFIVDEVIGNSLATYVADGNLPQTIPLNHGVAAITASKKEPLIVNDAYHDPRFNQQVDYVTGFKTRSLIASPILSSSGSLVGVIEMVNKSKGRYSQDDLKILSSFSSLASVALESKRIREINERGKTEIEMGKWIADSERTSYECPTKLRIPIAKQTEALSLEFSCVDWNGIGLFKIAFYVFNSFNILQQFGISNQKFFTFLFKLREEYKEVPFHNWIHAVDTLQYVCYEAKKCKLDFILSGLELFAVCVAAICHDAGHQGLTNGFSVASESPLGILFRNGSALENFHAVETIRVIENSNLFEHLSAVDLKKIWGIVISLILSTDMANHMKIVKQVNEMLDQGPINLQNEQHRLMALTLILKAADLANVSRPFEVASQWCDFLCEESCRQGDIEREMKMEPSLPMNDRKYPMKAKTEADFYQDSCLPLFGAISRIFPDLDVNLAAVNSNIEKWNEAMKEKDKK